MCALLGASSCTCHFLRRCAGVPVWSSSKPFTTFPHSIPSSLCVMPNFSSIKKCYHILNLCPSTFCAPPFLPHQPSPPHQLHRSYSTAALTPQSTQHSHLPSLPPPYTLFQTPFPPTPSACIHVALVVPPTLTPTHFSSLTVFRHAFYICLI